MNVCRTHNLQMRGWQGVITNQQLFVQLRTRAQAGELNLDIAIRVCFVFMREAAQMDHPLGEIYSVLNY